MEDCRSVCPFGTEKPVEKCAVEKGEIWSESAWVVFHVFNNAEVEFLESVVDEEFDGLVDVG